MGRHETLDRQEADGGTQRSYGLGFVLSIVLTLGAYLLVKHHVDSHHTAYSHSVLVAVLLLLAIIQLFVQLVFFLHLTRESKPRWNLIVMIFALLVVGIVVIGSLWIMHNLNYHNMSPSETDQYILHDEGVK